MEWKSEEGMDGSWLSLLYFLFAYDASPTSWQFPAMHHLHFIDINTSTKPSIAAWQSRGIKNWLEWCFNFSSPSDHHYSSIYYEMGERNIFKTISSPTSKLKSLTIHSLTQPLNQIKEENKIFERPTTARRAVLQLCSHFIIHSSQQPTYIYV